MFCSFACELLLQLFLTLFCTGSLCTVLQNGGKEHSGITGMLSIQNTVLSFSHHAWISYNHCIIKDSPPANGSNAVVQLYILPIEFYFSFSAVCKYYFSML